jgi:SAM-dependent methyltransferase
MMRFQTDLQYHNREEKARYVWQKYQEILQGSILDVGADEKYLTQHLPVSARYWGIGLGGSPDQELNLETGVIPFADNSFDTVLCLDVLEHLDNLHDVFDELCRVSRNHVIIALPNAWSGILRVILFGDYQPRHHMKYYGVPVEKPLDRHKWFLSYDEAAHFVAQRSAEKGMRLVQVDAYYSIDWRRWRNRIFYALSHALLRFSKVNAENFFISTMWAVLEKRERPNDA